MFRDGNIARDLNQDEFAANVQAFNVSSAPLSKSTPVGPVDPAILSEGNR